ncbi:MAG: hypothetical protein ACKO1Y_08055 [Actinomycetota bacterium]
MAIPRVAEDLTAGWLSEVLGREITEVTVEPIGVGVGLVGSLFRLRLVGGGAPTTMIAKLSAPTDEGRFVATVINMYGREVGFYSTLSERVTIAHPACFHAEHDPLTQDSVLLLEDVSARGTLLDSVVGIPVAEAGPMVRTLARHHAAFWDDPSLAEVPFLLRLADEPYPSAVAFAFDAAWPTTLEYLGDHITPAARAFGDAYPGRIAALYEKLCAGPHVLAHADWRLDNLFLAPDGEVIAIDWQLIDRSVGPRDLAYFVTQGIAVDDPAGYAQLLDLYLGELRSLGVEVDRDWAWEMYRYATAMTFVYPVIACGALTVNDERHLALCRTMVDRWTAAMDALDAYDLPL